MSRVNRTNRPFYFLGAHGKMKENIAKEVKRHDEHNRFSFIEVWVYTVCILHKKHSIYIYIYATLTKFSRCDILYWKKFGF